MCEIQTKPADLLMVTCDTHKLFKYFSMNVLKVMFDQKLKSRNSEGSVLNAQVINFEGKHFNWG